MNTRIQHPKQISRDRLRALFSIFNQHYDCVEFESFKKDLLEKDYVLVLENEFGNVVGFSTLGIWDIEVLGERIKLAFSGDTIIHREYWGTQDLVKAWCALVGRIKREFPNTRFYWLLISKGYRTYLYLPLFAKQFYPRTGAPTPFFEKTIMDYFGEWKYPDFYDKTRGVIAFDRSNGQLKPEIAGISPAHAQDENVRFFLDKNSGYRNGDELVCAAEISFENMKSIAQRYFWKGYAPVEQAKRISV